jgi:hypothetical protein
MQLGMSGRNYPCYMGHYHHAMACPRVADGGYRLQIWRIKMKLSSCFFNRAPLHEGVLGEWKYNSAHSLISALDTGEWSASRPGRFTPRERAPGPHYIGGWVGPSVVLDTVVKRRILSPCRESSPRNSIVQPVAQRYTD